MTCVCIGSADLRVQLSIELLLTFSAPATKSATVATVLVQDGVVR